MGLGMMTAAIRDRATTIRVVDGGLTTIQTPTRADYWFGHGYRLDFTPTGAELSALRLRGRRYFGALPGIQKFTIVWENDVPGQAADVRDEKIEETNVLCFHTKDWGLLDPGVFPLKSDEDWRGVERLILEEAEAEHGGFNRWVASCHRAAVADGRAELYGYARDGELIAFVGAHFEGSLGRFVTPYTLVGERGRGLFGVCAQWLFANASRRGVDRLVLEAEPRGYQERIYRRLGAQIVSRMHADVVLATDDGENRARA